MRFTAYAQLRLPQEAEAFAHLGFPAYFLPRGCPALARRRLSERGSRLPIPLPVQRRLRRRP